MSEQPNSESPAPTKMKCISSLHEKRKMRWKWMAGSAAVASGAASTLTATATPVQITLFNNRVTQTGGGLNADLTGDLSPDLIGLVSNRNVDINTEPFGSGYQKKSTQSLSALFSSAVKLGTARANRTNRSNQAKTNTYSVFVNYRASVDGLSTASFSPTGIRNMVRVIFRDALINNGAPTHGFVEVEARNAAVNSIQLVRLVFDDSNAFLAPGVVQAGDPPLPESSVADDHADARAVAEAARKAALRRSIGKKIKKLNKKLKRAKRGKKVRLVKKLKSQIKREKRKLAAV